MLERRDPLEQWLNTVIQMCTPDVAESPTAAVLDADDPFSDHAGSFDPFGKASAGSFDFGGGASDWGSAAQSGPMGGDAFLLPSPAQPLPALDPELTPSRAVLPTAGESQPLQNQGSAELLTRFFSVEESFGDSPGAGLTRAAGATGSDMAVLWPVDALDATAAVEAVLPALPYGVNCELLNQLGGGPCKAGWMHLEKRVPGLGTALGWAKRWFVIWPQTAHPQHGHLLFYFESEASPSAEGAIQLVAPVIRAPKSDREMYYSVRLNASQIRGVSLRPRATNFSHVQLDTTPTKFILGQTRIDSNIVTDNGTGSYQSDAASSVRGNIRIGREVRPEETGSTPEHGIKEWIQALRTAGPEWRVREDEVDRSDWLLKKGGVLGTWQRRWVELRGLEMLHYESEGDHPSGCWNLSDYTMCLPQLPHAHREREIILVPTSTFKQLQEDREAGGTGSPAKEDQSAAVAGESHLFCALSDDVFLAWKKALEAAAMAVATPEQLMVLPSVIGPWGLLASLGQSFSGGAVELDAPGITPESFDVMRLVGQGGFGKVFLVKRLGEEVSTTLI